MITGEELAAFGVFGHLSPVQRAAVAAVARECRYAPGQRVFGEDEPATGCWILRGGRVALSTSVPGRGDVVVQTLHERDVVGWSWLVPPYRWPFTATAAEAVDSIRLDATRLRELTAAEPTLCCALLRGLFDGVLTQLRTTQLRLLDVYGSPRER